MAEETKEAPSFVPAAPPPPRRVRDRSSFSQSEAPLATEEDGGAVGGERVPVDVGEAPPHLEHT